MTNKIPYETHCESCEEFTVIEIKVTHSGDSFCPEFGNYHYWEGFGRCPECGYENFIQDQSI